MVSGAVERHGRRQQRESLQAVIEEEVYGFVVQPEDHRLQKVDKVIAELVVVLERELILHQVGEEWIAKQVEEVGLLFDVLHKD